jgi:FkbM family methyltransferase
MNIYYGTSRNNINVTEICHHQLKKNQVITIPSGDKIRANYFTDPIENFSKSIFIESREGVTEFDEHYEIQIDCSTGKVTGEPDNFIKLLKIHSTLKLNHGSFRDEFPEQQMAVKYLKGKEKVLEIGGNIGRNSCVIGRLLDHSDFVSMECHPIISEQLKENRDLNGLTFHVENAALSKRKLIQRGWDTMPSDTLLEGYSPVHTITYQELKEKYKIQFDTLVLDCEGAFYYILLDMPEILDNIQLIIMENDYHDYTHKLELDAILIEKGFCVDYTEAGGWGPCYSHFFEVWKR